MLSHFLAAADQGRSVRVIEKITRHKTKDWVLTGGFAIEIHHLLRGVEPCQRVLTDIDFVVESFAAIPETLEQDFLFRHVHPFDPPNKTLLQAIDPVEAVRVDVFRGPGEKVSRSGQVSLTGATVRLISVEDLVARQARLAMDVAGGVPTAYKYARDFLRLLKLVNIGDVEQAWQDHRKPNHPASFNEASSLLQASIAACPDLLVTPEYSSDVTEICTRCRPLPAFQLIDPSIALSLLGYC